MSYFMKSKPLASLLAVALGTLSISQANADLIISEYVEGSSYNKAIELYNDSNSSIDLSDYQLKFYFNGNTTPATSINLSGTINGQQTFVIAQSQADAAILSVADQINGSSWFNGDDAIELVNASGLIDSIGQVGTDPGSYWGDSSAKTQNMTLLRKTTSSADTNSSDNYDVVSHWDALVQDDFSDLGQYQGGGSTNPGDIGACGDAKTFIHDIQGNGLVSPLDGQDVIIEAVVTADFTASGQLNSYFVQETIAEEDNDSSTSEGLMVWLGSNAYNLSVGERVRIAGTVDEYYGKTQLTNITDLINCGTSPVPAPTLIQLPLTSKNDLEAQEGMLVEFQQSLKVTENYNLGRYGELVLATDRLFQPTQLYRPGADAQQVADTNELSTIILDDYRTGQNPETIIYPTGDLSFYNTVRAGDTVDGVVGVMDYSFSAYRVQPTQMPTFTSTNPRTSAPQLPGTGNIRVASFNVLNYFNGDGQGGGFPTARGADTFDEFQRQRDKIINAILAMDADIIGIMEIENDGFGSNSAIQDLVDGLNALAPANEQYAYAQPAESQVGTDAIAVGILYRNSSVSEEGTAVTTDAYPFDDKNRQPLVQTFRHDSTGELITVAVNHFKSKGSCPSDGSANEDQGDFQGCWNERRTEASSYLANWLATDPTGAATSNIMILGDLNAYAKEDPVHELEQNGYVNLTQTTDHSYVFKGWSGSLDHALATSELASKLVGVTEWHINADEPRVLDYNVEYKTQAQIQDYYSTDAYRSSDHDPVIAEYDFQRVKKKSKLLSKQSLWSIPGVWRTYAVEVPAEVESLSVTLDGGQGNGDLYVRHAKKPNPAKFNCRSNNKNNTESCQVSTPQTGTWYIMVPPRWFYFGANLEVEVTE